MNQTTNSEPPNVEPTRYATMAYGEGAAVYRQAVMLLVSLLAHAPASREIADVLPDVPAVPAVATADQRVSAP